MSRRATVPDPIIQWGDASTAIARSEVVGLLAGCLRKGDTVRLPKGSEYPTATVRRVCKAGEIPGEGCVVLDVAGGWTIYRNANDLAPVAAEAVQGVNVPALEQVYQPS